MSDKLSQAEIDALFRKAATDGLANYEVIKYHYMVCLHCRIVIRQRDPKTHLLLSNRRCAGGTTHKFVSEEWLRDRRQCPVHGLFYPHIIQPLAVMREMRVEI